METGDLRCTRELRSDLLWASRWTMMHGDWRPPMHTRAISGLAVGEPMDDDVRRQRPPMHTSLSGLAVGEPMDDLRMDIGILDARELDRDLLLASRTSMDGARPPPPLPRARMRASGVRTRERCCRCGIALAYLLRGGVMRRALFSMLSDSGRARPVDTDDVHMAAASSPGDFPPPFSARERCCMPVAGAASFSLFA